MPIDDYFRSQYGLLTRQQALTAGMTRRQIGRRLSSGSWVIEHRGVYRLNAVNPDWHTRLLAAVLAVDGIASHRCAAALWHLDVYRTPPTEITVEESAWARMRDVHVHHSRQWDRRDPCLRQGIPCTGVERTILDCGAVAGDRTVERLAEAAIRKNYTSWLRLADCLREHSARGRDGCLTLRRVLQRRLSDRTVPLSDFSRLVTNLLVNSGVPEPVLEHRIVDDHGHLVLQADLAWPALRKAWELDGLQFHFGRTDIERDRRKRNRAIALGWNIQEILWSMYVDEPDELVTMAHRFLKA